MTPAETCRHNEWTVGTRLAGDEGDRETIIVITAIGESSVLARATHHKGRPAEERENMWVLDHRNWQEVDPA